MILTRIFDRIMDLQGDFEVKEFKIGQGKNDYSYAKLAVTGKNESHLSQMLNEIYSAGGISVELESVQYVKVKKNSVLPDNFYSTTNNPTFIYLNNKWIKVNHQMMDKAIVVDPIKNRAVCTMLRDIQKGDFVVVGEDGIKIVPPERPREGLDTFQFMSSHTSTEKPIQSISSKLARDLVSIKKKNGKIVIVGGPAIVHTGAVTSLSQLIRMGFVQGILAGNALLIHDVEHALLGTSLGIDVKHGSSTHMGHRNHILAVNELFKAGSVKQLVKSGKLNSGIFYECEKNKIPYVLAGSIRDDGPAPDVITDIVKAQKQYQKVLSNADLVIMLSTMLHSIAVGNMIPSTVKVVAIDINPSSVTKLLDRGTGQAIGVVSDVGSFLPILINDIKKLSKS
ncbi:MAG: TIGR00300 family protein [Thaumarchaeota archaeon]|nr:TIGR00300 family protein [Nitrososphaerota archaeon]